MILPSIFCTEAKNAFERSKSPGKFAGINVENDIAYIVYTTPAGTTEKMLWTNGADMWESIFRWKTKQF